MVRGHHSELDLDRKCDAFLVGCALGVAFADRVGMRSGRAV